MKVAIGTILFVVTFGFASLAQSEGNSLVRENVKNLIGESAGKRGLKSIIIYPGTNCGGNSECGENKQIIPNMNNRGRETEKRTTQNKTR